MGQDSYINTSSKQKPALNSGTGKTKRIWEQQKYLFFMLIPVMAYFIIFHYVPMCGIVIAFKDFSMSKGILGSPWAGFKWFDMAFSSNDFISVLRNTLLISLYKMAWGFPAPIILALLLNEVNHTAYKKVIQSITYLPHLMSWVVLGGIFITLLAPETGAVNHLIRLLGGEPIYFLAEKEWFRPVVVATHVWQSMGWGSIIYLAAIAGISNELYEAAIVDGANRWQRMRHITLPGIMPTAAVLLILNMGGILNAGFDQIFNLENPMVYEVGDIIDTYVYRVGLVSRNYELATAVGLFKSAIGLILILITNRAARSFGDYGIW